MQKKSRKKTKRNKTKKISKRFSNSFADFNDLLKAYYQKKMSLHHSVWVRKNSSLESENTLDSTLEIRINPFRKKREIFPTYHYLYNSNGQKIEEYIRTTPGRVLLNTLLFEGYA